MSLSIKRRLLLLATCALLAPMPSPGQSPVPPFVTSDDGPGAGTLLLRAPGIARAVPAVRLGTDIAATVTGPVARVRVTQVFRNASAAWMEARYLFPLLADGAVDGLKMVVGTRVIVGRIERREAAQRLYAQAKAAGQKAGLLEQQRPNIFATRIANVGPGETVLVQIEFQAPVAQANGTFSLRLPLVVAPRYVPPHTLGSPAARADAAAMTAAPVLHPALGAGLNPTSITVRLAPGYAPANLVSRYHPVQVTGTGEERQIRLVGGEVPADRDFELAWRPAGATPLVGLFRQHARDGDYLMAAITPPTNLTHLPAPPREMVFVIDNSGSMGGASMDQAKASLVRALRTLRPQDSFNVIRFDDTLTRLFPHSVPAAAGEVARAVRFAEGLEADGGTEILPALRAALDDATAAGGAERLRQIVFLTDGAVSNEAEMLAALAAAGGRVHTFFVGIGSAPNDHLMARMATVGRGSYTHVGTADEVAARLAPMLDRLAHPAMTDLRVSAEGGAIDLTPAALPDLYAGEPLVLVGRAATLPAALTISGTVAGRPWRQRIDLTGAIESEAIEKLWSRRRIDDVEVDRTLGRLDEARADAAVEALGLAAGLVTSRTSLVAVDQTPTRPAGVPLRAEDLPINLPAGWDFGTLFGGQGRAVPPPAPAIPDAAAPLELPQTATGFAAMVAQGLALLLLGLAGLRVRRRRAA